MTLIAQIADTTGRVLIGDALLSTDKSHHADTPIPTQSLPNELDNVYETGHRIVGLGRKIFPINEYLYFGWCGDLSDYISPVGFLFDNLGEKVLPATSLEDVTNRSGLYDVKGAWFLAGECEAGCFMISNNFETKMIGTVELQAAGSGADHFVNGVFEQVRFGHNSSVLMDALFAIGVLLARQNGTGDGLADFYGGAFDILSAEGRGFVPLDKVLYVFRRFCVEPEAPTSPQAGVMHKEDGVYHTIEAVYYVFHDKQDLCVAVWSNQQRALYSIANSFRDVEYSKSPETDGLPVWVVEVAIHHYSGRVSCVLKHGQDTKQYVAKVSLGDWHRHTPVALGKRRIKQLKSLASAT